MANKGSISASGFAPGGGISGKVSGRPLGRPGEKTYMSAIGAPKNYMNHQVTCSGGYPSVSSNKGQTWKPNQKSGIVPKNVFPATVRPNNYKRRQDNGR